VELRIFEKLLDPFPAYLFSDASMHHFDFAVADRAAHRADTISISARFVPESVQELRAFCR